MNRFSALLAEITEYLSSCFESGQISVVQAFPGRARQHPPRKKMISAGIESIDFCGSPLGGPVKITIRFDLLSPVDGGGACHQMFHELCDALACGGGPFSVSRISSGGAAFEESQGALVMTARAVLEGILPPAEDPLGIPVSRIRLKRAESSLL